MSDDSTDVRSYGHDAGVIVLVSKTRTVAPPVQGLMRMNEMLHVKENENVLMMRDGVRCCERFSKERESDK